MNGKAGNVNNALATIYRDRPADSLRDVLAIFDCDQVCAPDFFTQALPLLNGAPDVAMVRLLYAISIRRFCALSLYDIMRLCIAAWAAASLRSIYIGTYC